MGIFSSIFGSNKKNQTGKRVNKVHNKESKIDVLGKSRLTPKEIEKIKEYETQWSEKVKQSKHIKVSDRIVEDLIQYWKIRNSKPNDKGMYTLKKTSYKKKMLEIEKSLIDKFLLNNEYFISGKKRLVFLTDKERNTFFTHYKMKYGNHRFIEEL